MSSFPVIRLRRLRRTDTLRALVRETHLSLDDVVMPLFACPGEGIVRPVTGLEGIAQRSVDEIVREAAELASLGVRAVILFGIPEEKDEEGSGAWEEGGIVQRALRLHPLLVIFGLLAGGELYGIAGVLLALPTMAAARAIWEFFAERVQFDSWDDDDSPPLEIELDGPRGSPADVPLPR